ncbi:MAG TPA: N-acetyl-D-Glu racemase DgcA [Thermoanaerobaculia bacterium]|nr:N-acetyl-D-Glu racemase DgcA [Thermoanaerobaculia bacterium]
MSREESARLEVAIEIFPIRGRFAISRGSRTESRVVTVTIERDGVSGRGECVPYAHFGETPDGVVAAIESSRDWIESAAARGAERRELLDALPAGAARNAIDAALWDLEARSSGVPAWRAAGLEAPPTARTVRTLSLDDPETMGEQAAALRDFATLKLKLDGGPDAERVAAVREAAPGATLIVDANEAWAPELVEERLATLAGLGVAMVEQPVAPACDDLLRTIEHPVPLCADEAFHTAADLDRVAERYDMVNLKLDKTGGVTCALDLRREAEARGLEAMVGCMVGTSLSMAPALILAQGLRFVDLDGPYLLARDREPGLGLGADGRMTWNATLWGG